MKCQVCKSTFTGSECPDCSTEPEETFPPTAAQIANAMWDEAYRNEPISPALRAQADKAGLLVPRLPDAWADMADHDYSTLDLFDRWLHYTGQNEAMLKFALTLAAANVRLPFHMWKAVERDCDYRTKIEKAEP